MSKCTAHHVKNAGDNLRVMNPSHPFLMINMAKNASFRCEKCHEIIFINSWEYGLIKWHISQDKYHSLKCNGIMKRYND